MKDSQETEYQRLMHEEMQDNLDEELEMELDDDRLDDLLQDTQSEDRGSRGLDRRTYFRELLRLQAELVNLQDWVVEKNLKVVVIFEGRDAARPEAARTPR